MKKICLTLVGIYMMVLHSFGQYQQDKDTTFYVSKPLKIDEINLVSSYYKQNGDHSAVTGGIGTEKVTDLSNGLEVKWVGWDYMNRKHTLTAGLGIDHHTSASSAYVNKSGASKTGGSRIYPSLNWNMENAKKGTGVGLGIYFSKEYNYTSFGLDAEVSKKTKNNGEFGAKLRGYFDRVKLIYPSEFVQEVTVTSASGEESRNRIPSKPRTTGTLSLSFSQVINKRLQGIILVDGVYQNGYLGLPFHRVYFNNGTEAIETLPSNRLKLPIGVRLNYFLGDKIILRSYYRYYIDSWGLQSHTASLEVPVKITPFVSVAPFYRYYTQTAVKYFAPYETHTSADQYYTSNYALSAFNSQFYGVNFRVAPPKGITKGLSALELRYGHYSQTTNLVSNVISVNFTFK
ncbi:DUF3570 domain-containing protein [Ginsengibacter hankyongi]|uniref:DUF3570 domain-containing protein n=1 Tax=Ginsengibacter hankyongi TaxID=2607284 RepID=A0A5J5IK64_9BACT|nr:DUF3570 domain-containing protein [Ginsengibacter hankyongi]KAA9040938.1 DUF3570 domain-containing protein [Ginsengibacter hankyongi]